MYLQPDTSTCPMSTACQAGTTTGLVPCKHREDAWCKEYGAQANENNALGFDFETALVADCRKSLLAPPVPTQANATFERPVGFFVCQSAYAVNVSLYIGCTVGLYLIARGQGIIGNALLVEFVMQRKHVLALIFWLIASTGSLLAAVGGIADYGTPSGCWFIAVVSGSMVSIGFLGIIGVLWQESVATWARTASRSQDGPTARHVIFGSMRFPVPPEATQLQTALRACDTELIIVDLQPGDDINESVFQSIEQADAFLVFGTSGYGEKTQNPACTYWESEFARNAGKKIILLRMIPWGQEFDHLQARVMFGMNELTLSWIQGTPMPETLVENILLCFA